MPPKTRITKEMIIDAAFEIARTQGYLNINARTVSTYLKCSTQPILYHFKTIEELKRAVYEKVDAYHTDYLLNIGPQQYDMMLGIGLNYIRFAVEEPNLFCFLFQSGFANENNLLEMINSEQVLPIITAMQEVMEMDIENTKSVFLTISMFV